MKTATIRIGGMTCISCQNRIEKKLKSTVGVEQAAVSFSAGTAAVTYNTSVVTMKEITEAIEKLDYRVLDGKYKADFSQIAGMLIIILSLYVLLQGLGVSALASAFPLAEAGMGYGMLFIIGLVTSVHCVAMCGGINLSQCIPQTRPEGGRRWETLLPSILYNGGRVLSYTAVGIIVGALGSVITVSGRFQGAVQLAAGVFMVMMGINMLGIFQGSVGTTLRRFSLHMPKIFAKKIDEQKTGNKSPLIIGLLNALMPCGPLQAMQLYALSTGSPIAGGISMFLFSMGTVPLMFGIGALSSVLSKKFTLRVMKAGAVLVTVLGMTMFTNGWNLAGINFNPLDSIRAAFNPFAAPSGAADAETFEPLIENGYQIVNSSLSGGRYPAITVQQGIPVKWTINAPQGSINGCNNRMIIREYKIEHRFQPGENVIEFTPDKTGRFSYSCWMGMIRSSITVVAEGENVADIQEPDTTPVPAGVAIPTDKVLLAEIQGTETYGFSYQAITIKLRDDGMDTGIIVFQRDMPALLTINNDSLDPGNSRLIFPAYYTQIDMEQGDNIIQLMPTDDFDFSTGDNVFYGYVKVVDDLNAVDIEAIKAEVGNFETKIYPDAYFEAAASQGGCCGRAGA
ncbi:sulfite exporter TauE/SafE family protein [Treponema sp. TIM-1]|uniref:urease accessory protein UreH domain-containing protein n=1 Tax=Treponema sp. TIM-1 TaxID=2898417 RepID=UPI00397F16FC